MQRAMRRWLGQRVLMAGAVAAVVGVGGHAQADLTYDLRVVGGGKTALVNTVGQWVDLELHAVVTGAPGNPGLEAMAMACGSFLSDRVNGEMVRGDLSTAMVVPFNGLGAYGGRVQDLNGDGDLDVGATAAAAYSDYFAAGSAPYTITLQNAAALGATFTSLADGGIDVVVGRARYVVTGLVNSSASIAQAQINFAPAVPAGLLRYPQQWHEDGKPLTQPKGTVKVGAPVSVQIGGTPWIEPPLAVRMNYSTVPAGSGSLVVVTHGRVPFGTTDPQQTWTQGLADEIQGYLNGTGQGTQWQTATFKWTDAAIFSASEMGAVVQNRAQEAGLALGKQIAAQHRPFVHLIGEDAGAAVVQEAIRVLRVESPETVVEATFLDPFVGRDYRGLAEYGVGATWADSYYAHDHNTANHWGAATTEGLLLYAHNVDVTALDPNVVANTRTPVSDYGPLGHLVSSSTWPHQFYLNTVAGTQAGSQGYGFLLSMEGGGASLQANYPEGNTPVVLDGTGGSTSPYVTITQATAVDLENAPKSVSTTGQLQTTGTKATFKTGSPVWLTASVDLSAAANLLTLDAEFLSANGAEGLLSVYWGDTLLGSIDERYAIAGMQSYTFSLPDTLAPGQYTFTLRLDPFTGVQSVAQIDHVRPGLIALVPEPATLGLLGLGTLVLLRRRA